MSDGERIPPALQQGLITTLNVILTASLLYLRFVLFEPASGSWGGVGLLCAVLAGLSLLLQFYGLWRALQPDSDLVFKYRITLRCLAAAIALLVVSVIATAIHSAN